MKLQILILFLLCSHLLNAQDSEKLIKDSEKYILENKHHKFENTYAKIWKVYLKEQIPNYYNATKQTKKNDYENAFKNIDSLVSEDYLVKDILEDKMFDKLHKTEKWRNLEQNIKNTHLSYNKKVRRKLLKLRDEDQSIRLILLDVRKAHPKNKDLLNKIREKMKQIDRKNAKIIENIIDKYGWLGKDIVGEQGNQALFLGIQHIDELKVQTKYLPIIKNAVKKGDAEPWHYAYLTDRILMNQGKKQIYGTQTIISSNPKNSYVVPLENPEKVDELRQEFGLEPLKEYLEEMGIDWNLEEYKKNEKRIEKMYKERFEKRKKK